jgi:hypothetical protein
MEPAVAEVGAEHLLRGLITLPVYLHGKPRD